MTEIHQRVLQIKAGRYSPALAKLKSGYVVMGDPQVLPGYCLIYPDPVVPHLNALPASEAHQFLKDMHLVGDIVLQVTNAARINYEILGNLAPALHAHVIPRYKTEPTDLITKPIWYYDWVAAPKFSLLEHDEIFHAIRSQLYLHGGEKV